MIRTLRLVAFIIPLLLWPSQTRSAISVPAGRWEIVNTSGDNSSQNPYGPGSFSVFLNSDGSSYVFATSTNSQCVPNLTNNNVVPTWISVGASQYQITIAINNNGLAPNLSFVYTGTYNPSTPVPGTTSLFVPAISGTYYPVGDASLCSTATQSNPGNFVATFLPTLTSGSASGPLAGADVNNSAAFDSVVNATITFSGPPTPGQMAGTVSLASNPTFQGIPCFATTNGVVSPLTIDPSTSIQAGVIDYIFAQGLDPEGNPTTLFLPSLSANFYSTNNNTDQFAIPLTNNEWAAGAAIGEDNPAVAPVGVSNDGTNNNIAVFYRVMGGACDGANASNFASPFNFVVGNLARTKRRPAPPRHQRRWVR